MTNGRQWVIDGLRAFADALEENNYPFRVGAAGQITLHTPDGNTYAYPDKEMIAELLKHGP